MADINVTEEIIDINVTEEVITIEAPTGAYPFPNAVFSVFGRVGSIVATEGDYTLTQLGGVTITTPSNGQVLKYNGTQWVNSTDADTGITTLNTLTALSQTFATGTSGTDFNISSATSTHTFNLPVASAANTGKLSSTDWTTFNAKQNAVSLTTTGTSGAATYNSTTGVFNIPQYQGVLTNPVTGTGTTNTLPKFTGASTIGNSNITDTGSLITLISDTAINGLTSGSLGRVLPAGNTFGGIPNGGNITLTGSANGWALINRQTWNVNDDAFTYNGLTANTTNIVVNRSATSVIGYTAFNGTVINNGSASQFATIIAATTSNASTGSFLETTIYRAGAFGPYTNTNSYTSYFAFRAQFNPQNITNYYGLEIADVTPTTLARAINLSISAGTNKFNVYAGGTAANYMAGKLLIGSTTDVPSASIAITSTTQGFLPPRMTTTEKNAISSPATGLIVFDTTLNKLCVFAVTWQTITST